MIIMSVDLGKARTGIAICDKLESMAFPNQVITEYNREVLYKKIANIAKENKVELIVVGLPKNMDGSLGFKAEECKEAAQKIEEITNIKTVLYDERCTTVLAHTALKTNGVFGKKRKAVVDAVAAVMILEDYLNYRKNNNN